MKTLAIIGTAGRGSDASRLNAEVYGKMLDACSSVIEKEGVRHLVSGGAAWADHCAVTIHLTTGIPLTLWLPEYPGDLQVAQHYHRLMEPDLTTWNQVLALNGNKYKGFKDRNSKVADVADCFIAMTFGEGAVVKDGGTADTVKKIQARGIKGYHFNLNENKLYACADL